MTTLRSKALWVMQYKDQVLSIANAFIDVHNEHGPMEAIEWLKNKEKELPVKIRPFLHGVIDKMVKNGQWTI